jgi:hypothetical protein
MDTEEGHEEEKKRRRRWGRSLRLQGLRRLYSCGLAAI